MDRSDFLRVLGLGSLLPIAGGLSEAKPRLDKIRLKEFFIAGFIYYDGIDEIEALSLGDVLELRPEPENVHDEEAIEIYTRQGVKLGYVPRIHNTVMAELIRQRVPLQAVVTEIKPDNDPWEMVKVEVAQRVSMLTAN